MNAGRHRERRLRNDREGTTELLHSDRWAMTARLYLKGSVKINKRSAGRRPALSQDDRLRQARGEVFGESYEFWGGAVRERRVHARTVIRRIV